ncbi:hypothetical protein [Stygiolobus caldivivus]|uniref:Zinc ribbon domain-containing protein n=1 Tax=Stygiolobus caldivivus TaxID=2824673 RepID=A0A8D5U6G2_9CREN|nr:hypothetical protein [Stygiolobus caldivivus]BCU70122.1 hypothetical protein KN1_14190 [Stygiolobus caldivivus]
MPKVCPRCGYVNDDLSIICSKCGYHFPETRHDYQYYFPKKKKRNLPIISVVILTIVLLGIGGFLLYKNSVNTVRVPISSSVPAISYTPISLLKYQGCAISFNGVDQYFITPIFYIKDNGENVPVGLFSYVAMEYKAETIAIRAYLTPNTRGVLIGLSKDTLPFNPPKSGWSPLVYISHGKLIIADISNNSLGSLQAFLPIKPFKLVKTGIGQPIPTPNGGEAAMCVSINKPGFYWVLFQEWSADGMTYIAGYINGELIAEFCAPFTDASSLFGEIGPYKYNFVGVAFTKQWPQTNYQWYPFKGYINSIVVYPSLLSKSQMYQLGNGTIPGGYIAAFIASSSYYNQKSGVWYAYNNTQLGLIAVGNPCVASV